FKDSRATFHEDASPSTILPRACPDDLIAGRVQMFDGPFQADGVKLPRRPQAAIDGLLEAFQRCGRNVEWSRLCGCPVCRHLRAALFTTTLAHQALDVREGLAPVLGELLAGMVALPLLAQRGVAA